MLFRSDVYAHAAEMRGAWDARLEALVIDSVMRGDADETTRTRASALGWTDTGSVAVVVGQAPEPSADGTIEALIDEVRRAVRARRSEEHTSELQSRQYLVCRLLLEKKNTKKNNRH